MVGWRSLQWHVMLLLDQCSKHVMQIVKQLPSLKFALQHKLAGVKWHHCQDTDMLGHV